MTGVPLLWFLAATTTFLASAAHPPLGSAAVLFAAICLITYWREHARRKHT